MSRTHFRVNPHSTLFVILFKNGNYDPKINYFDEYYMPLVEIKAFNR